MIAFLMFASSVAAFSFPSVPKVDTPQYKWLQEAEKKHGRAALVAAPSLAIIAMATGEDPVPWLNHQPAATQLTFYSVVGILESFNLRRIDQGFTLKSDEKPGRLLPIRSDLPGLNKTEDYAGRVAMLIAAATIASSAAHALF